MLAQSALRPAEAAGHRILVVEDERIVARDLCRTLQEMGYLVGAAARSSAEALAQVALEPPDLVLMDIHIRGHEDGIEAAAQLKLRHPIPVIFLTASTDEETQRRALQVRPDGYLPKPFARTVLRTTIEVALQRHAVEVKLRQTNAELASQKAELQQRASELGLLGEMGEVLALCDNADEALGVVARFGRRLFPADGGALYLLDDSGKDFRVAATWGMSEPTACFEVSGCRSLRRGLTHRSVPPDDQLRCTHLDPARDVASICVPLMAHGRANGVLSLTLSGGPGLLPAEVDAREQLATVAAQRIGLTLRNMAIHDQLRRESILDPLTGLFNRRHLTSAFDRELRLASRGSRSIGLLMLDIDHFKSINDQWGHAAADWVLCEQARFLRGRLRAYDIPARYGGDETVVLLPDTSLEDSVTVAVALHEGMRAIRVHYGGAVLPPVSISVGVAAYPLHGVEVESILAAADGALYRAKAAGRDRVVVAAAPGPDARSAPAGG